MVIAATATLAVFVPLALLCYLAERDERKRMAKLSDRERARLEEDGRHWFYDW